MVKVCVHTLPHLGVFLLQLEPVGCRLLQQGEQLLRFRGTVAEQLGLHVDVGALGLVVLFQVELVEDDRFALVVHVPADAGIVGDQQLALHHQLVQGLGAEGDERHSVAGDGEVLDVYTVNPETATGTNMANEVVSLPQTGYSDIYKVLVGLATLMTVGGGTLIVKTREKE